MLIAKTITMIPKAAYRKIVLNVLSKLKRGKLHLRTGGEDLYFGEGEVVNASVIVHDEKFFKRVVLFGDVGFGESYMDGLWETPDLTKVVQWFISNVSSLPGMSGAQKTFNPINLLKFSNRIEHILRPNSRKGSRSNIAIHYDLSNDFFSLFLDSSMTYSSALFTRADQTLESAQMEKYDSLCRAAKITSSHHVLEIGCGWGGFAIFAAKKYGCRVTGITISEEQYAYAVERVKQAGLENRIEIMLKDYRQIEGQFERVVSIEMIEAVGHRWFRPYFGKISKVLKKDGVLALQAIVIPDNRYNEYRKSVDWIQKHIFPGGLLPSVAVINETINKTGNLNLYGLKEMGLSYAETLKTWHYSFEANIEKVKKIGFDERFIRRWKYYLCSSEAAFKERNINVVQMIYARPNISGF